MKTSFAILLSAVWCSAQAAAATAAKGRVYTYHPNSPHAPKPRLLAPETARLVLAQRVGAEDYHIVRHPDQNAIAAINDFGLPKSLFGGERTKTALIHVHLDGVLPEEALGFLHDHHSFDVAPLPAASATRDLLHDLGVQARLSDAGGLYSFQDIASFEKAWSQLVRDGDHSITALFTPGDSTSSNARSATWGTYEMPSAQSLLHKRSPPQKEAPLELAPVQYNSAPLPTFASNSSNATNTPLIGILPSCFASQSACQSSTRNCTGHGKCYRKYTDPSAKENSRHQTCWACSCGVTSGKNKDGNTITTRWGGPACQKKDVSVQFWLITLFTVGLVFVVCFAIGQVWTMGGEELPSVIGAGVSGPVKK